MAILAESRIRATIPEQQWAVEVEIEKLFCVIRDCVSDSRDRRFVLLSKQTNDSRISQIVWWLEIEVEISKISLKRERFVDSENRSFESRSLNLKNSWYPRNNDTNVIRIFPRVFHASISRIAAIGQFVGLLGYLYRTYKRRTCSKRWRGNYGEEEELQRRTERRIGWSHALAGPLGRGRGEPLEQFQSRSHKSSFESWIAATGRTRTRNARALCIVRAWIGVARHNSPSFFPPFFCSSLRTSRTGNTPLLRQYTTLLFAIYARWGGKFFLAHSVYERCEAGNNGGKVSFFFFEDNRMRI